MTDSNRSPAFTEAESKMIVTILKHATSSDIQTAWDAVATELGYKDAKSARNRWGNIKRDKFGSSAVGGGAASTGGVNKKSPNKKSPVKPKNAGGDVEKKSPAKSKGGGKSKSAVAMEDEEGVTVEQSEEPDADQPTDGQESEEAGIFG